MTSKLFLKTLILCLVSFNSFSQTYIRFSNTPIIESDLNTVPNVLKFNSTDPVYIAFEIHDVQKMKLLESESIFISMRFLSGVQPIENYKISATQDNQGVIRGSGVIIPPTNEAATFDVNTIHQEFHYRFLQEMEKQTANQKKWKVSIDEFDVTVYDHLKGYNTRIGIGMFSEDADRFPQFSGIMPNIKLKKVVEFSKELSKDYPFSDIINKSTEKAEAQKKEMYSNLTNKTKAPKDYLNNDFKGFDGEITRVDVEKIAFKLFNNTDYKLKMLSYYNSSISNIKKNNGFPDYKTFDVGFYATKNNGKCAYGRITISSNFNGVSYDPWKIFNNKLIDCLCE
ncbi:MULTISPECIES: hypothetical protein [unclassified Flavobacterium]|uniref:hypothetical protein n=1 Tax=unclassified Flavobacterium TaxID=196869 RepID=UPI00129213B1|nr:MULTISPECIES: hypothetical protein [unclassified Flavobacterium]MQP52278.1 hypothetical protein [Flavobacterium sp. LMO9]MQP62348.1 hypothetical protein [Flavobacterium sp. LMO6]